MSHPETTSPTLASVRATLPSTCFEHDPVRSIRAVTVDVAAYLSLIVAMVVVGPSPWLVPLSVATGVVVAGLFVLGHDAAHGALLPGATANRRMARLLMLPSLHVAASWVLGHNRVHHGFTTRQGMDFVWHPLTEDEYRELGSVRRLRHRFEWSALGSGAYYGREVWWNKMMTFTPDGRRARSIRRDRALVVAVAAVSSTAVTLVGGLVHDGLGAGLVLCAAVVAVPFVVFVQIIGWTVYVHHVDPEIRWWRRDEWTPWRAQMESTTVLRIPVLANAVFHNIFVHVPHHVDPRIPWYRLPEAATAIEREFPGVVVDRRFRLRDYLRAARTCKLYDFAEGRWVGYPAT